jgi:Lsr2
MAKSTIIQLTDDLDGSAAVEGVTFGFRGTEYEIDLNAKNVAALEKVLDRYITAGRKVSRSKSNGAAGRRGRSSAKAGVGDLREWARANGYTVSDRGRIPGEIRDAYEAAQA